MPRRCTETTRGQPSAFMSKKPRRQTLVWDSRTTSEEELKLMIQKRMAMGGRGSLLVRPMVIEDPEEWTRYARGVMSKIRSSQPAI